MAGKAAAKAAKKAAREAAKADAKAEPVPASPAPEGKRLELTTRQRDLLKVSAVNAATKAEIGERGKMVTVTIELMADLETLVAEDLLNKRVWTGLFSRAGIFAAQA